MLTLSIIKADTVPEELGVHGAGPDNPPRVLEEPC
jgi:hypothetical protein